MEKELVEFMVRSLVDQPDEVSVNVIEGEKSTILELHVAEGDVGKVIGKQGRIAKAIRTILSASATRLMEELLSTATIGRTHGVEGFLKVYSLSGEYAHLKKLKSAVAVSPDGKEKLLSVSQVRSQGEMFLMQFSGYETPEKARVLSGSVLKVRREDARKLKKGEYYIADLYGLSVIYNGEKVGVVKDVSEGAQAMLLQVEREGKIYLVPNISVFVSRPDFQKGEIELLMGDLLEL